MGRLCECPGGGKSKGGWMVDGWKETRGRSGKEIDLSTDITKD